ncbi:MAG: hypothetical protein AAFV29_14170, partial [Myxococcota bacterium]
VTQVDAKTQIVVRWIDAKTTAAVTRVVHAPRQLTWSPDGKHLAFTMTVPSVKKPLVKLP